MKPTLSQADRIAKLRMQLILTTPFFGALIMRLQMIEDPSAGTFCTNGKTIRYSPEYAASLTDGEARWILAEEVLHCALGHLWRLGARDLERWNAAADYAIHAMLQDYVKTEGAKCMDGGMKYTEPFTMPKDSLFDPKFAGMATEAIYNELAGDDGGGGRKPSPGAFVPALQGELPSDATPEDLRVEWQVATVQAATAAKQRGKLPGALERFVKDLLQPKVPWREVLREFVRSISRDDYSWRHANRRYVHAGVILPSLHSERMGPLVVAVDTSGSITDRVLAEFQAEVQAALDECSPERITVLYCDAEVRAVEEFLPGDAVRLRARGGGGTDFKPVFDHVAEHAEDDPAALIYLTDGWGCFPEAEPAYPVLWATNDSDRFPWGQVVSVK